MSDTATVVTKEEVMEALHDVFDPEIPVNVVDLGLIYGCDVEDNNVTVEMTLTFAGCGMGPYIAQQAEWRIAEIEAVEDVNVEVVFDPPWNPDLITEEGITLVEWPEYIPNHLTDEHVLNLLFETVSENQKRLSVESEHCEFDILFDTLEQPISFQQKTKNSLIYFFN